MKKYYFFFSFLILCFVACTEENKGLTFQPGNYGTLISVGVNSGQNWTSTKAFDDQDRFTGAYDGEYIYLHSKDNPSKVLSFSVQEEPECGKDCLGFRMYINVAEDGSVTVYNYDPDGDEPVGSSMELTSEENIYFSSQEKDVWDAIRVEDEVSPISEELVFVRDENNNIELFRSHTDYTANGLNGLANLNHLEMDRVCSAYQVRCVVTDLDNDVAGDGSLYTLTATAWEELTGTNFEDWTIKLYLGPLFPQHYDLSKANASERVSYDDGFSDGYYVTNNQSYTGFLERREVSRGSSDEEGGTIIYRGIGLVTTSDFLIAPVQENTNEYMYAYVFVKYDNSENPDDKSNEGAKYIQVPITDLPGRVNYTEQINIVIDADVLYAAFRDEITASNSVSNEIITKGLHNGFEKIDMNALVFVQ